MMRGRSLGFSRLPGPRGGGPRARGREPAALRAGVHVRLVVVAQVDEVVVALGRAGERLDADVAGAAVARHREHRHLVVAPGRAQPGGEAGGRGRGRRERDVDPRDLDRRGRIHAAEHREAARRHRHDHAAVERLGDRAQADADAAAGAGAVAGQDVLAGGQVDDAGHCAPPVSLRLIQSVVSMPHAAREVGDARASAAAVELRRATRRARRARTRLPRPPARPARRRAPRAGRCRSDPRSRS